MLFPPLPLTLKALHQSNDKKVQSPSVLANIQTQLKFIKNFANTFEELERSYVCYAGLKIFLTVILLLSN